MSDLTTSASESGALPEAARGDQRVVVRSIGTSPAAVTNALRGFAGGWLGGPRFRHAGEDTPVTAGGSGPVWGARRPRP